MFQRMLQWLFSWMSLTKLLSWPDWFRTARSQDRAVLLWALAIIVLGGLALTEKNIFAALMAGVLLPLLPERVSTSRRILMLIASACVFIFGTTVLLISVPVCLYVSSVRAAAPIAILGLASEKLLIHHFQSTPDIVGQSIHLGSLIYLIIPILFAVVILNRELGWRATVSLLSATVVVLLNESARVFMRRSGFCPTFSLTAEQESYFANYGPMNSIRASIAARILSGDPSALEPTGEQLAFVQELRNRMGL
jgi:hypothetical protein